MSLVVGHDDAQAHAFAEMTVLRVKVEAPARRVYRLRNLLQLAVAEIGGPYAHTQGYAGAAVLSAFLARSRRHGCEDVGDVEAGLGQIASLGEWCVLQRCRKYVVYHATDDSGVSL
jgi:hypothetical protein